MHSFIDKLKEEFFPNITIYNQEIRDFLKIIYIEKSTWNFATTLRLFWDLSNKFTNVKPNRGTLTITISDLITNEILNDIDFKDKSYAARAKGIDLLTVYEPLRTILGIMFNDKKFNPNAIEIFKNNSAPLLGNLVDFYTLHLSWTLSCKKINEGNVVELYSRLFDKLGDDKSICIIEKECIDCNELKNAFNKAYTYCIQHPKELVYAENQVIHQSIYIHLHKQNQKNLKQIESVKSNIGETLTKFLNFKGTQNKLFETVRYLSVFFTGELRTTCFDNDIEPVYDEEKDIESIIEFEMNRTLYLIMSYMHDTRYSDKFNITFPNAPIHDNDDAYFFDIYYIEYDDYFRAVLELITTKVIEKPIGGSIKLKKTYLPSCICKDGRNRKPFRIQGRGNTLYVMYKKQIIKKTDIPPKHLPRNRM